MLLKFAKKPNGGLAKFKFRDPSIVFIDPMQHFGGSIDGNVKQLLAGCFGSTNASDFTKDKKEQTAIRNFFDNAVFVISPQWDDLTLSPAVSPRVQFRTAVSNPDVINKVEEFLMTSAAMRLRSASHTLLLRSDTFWHIISARRVACLMITSHLLRGFVSQDCHHLTNGPIH
jgi:hypothetical protein